MVLQATALVAIFAVGGCASDHSSSAASASSSSQNNAASPTSNAMPFRYTDFVKTTPPEMTFSLPEGWRVYKDLPGELVLEHQGSPGAQLIAWQNAVPTEFDGKALTTPIGPSAQDFATWLEGSPDLNVTAVDVQNIGGATTLAYEVEIDPEAENGDPGCPALPCVLLVDTPELSLAWGISRGMGSRLYLVDRPDGERLLLIAQDDTPTDLSGFVTALEPVLASIAYPT